MKPDRRGAQQLFDGVQFEPAVVVYTRVPFRGC